MRMEQLWHDIHRGTPKYSEKIPSLCHFVRHKSHAYWFRSEQELPQLDAYD